MQSFINIIFTQKSCYSTISNKSIPSETTFKCRSILQECTEDITSIDTRYQLEYLLHLISRLTKLLEIFSPNCKLKMTTFLTNTYQYSSLDISIGFCCAHECSTF